MEGIHMLQENNVITGIARELVSTYTQHIEDRIKDLDRAYIQLGVDKTFKEYEALFKVVIAKVLGLPKAPTTTTSTQEVIYYPQTVINECVIPLIDKIQEEDLEKFLDSRDNAIFVHEVCMYVLDKVREDKFSHEPVDTISLLQ